MWEHAAALAWWSRAQAGEVWTPYSVSRDAASALLWAVVDANDRDLPDGRHLVINTEDGDRSVWQIAQEVELGAWTCFVRKRALSAGLILACACTEMRYCSPDAQFLFHGLNERHPEKSDQHRSEWFAARTKMPVEFWLSHCAEDFRFGAEDALEFGVVHDVIGAEEVSAR